MSEITTIFPKTVETKKRVAAYCRVSTKHEAQNSSIEIQMEYYEQYIKSNTNWEFAGVYADRKSGLRVNKQTGLLELNIDIFL